MSRPVIEVKDVSFHYGGVTALDRISLTIHEDDFIAVIGPNGGGKTTLLKLILGLLDPTSGSIRVMGQPPRRVSHHIGYVPQDIHANLQFPITVRDVVAMGRLAPGRSRFGGRGRDRRDAMAALARMEMDAFADKRVGELSGGQRQRVFIARALVSRPDILLLDEPTANIDAAGQTRMYRLLKQLSHKMPIIVVSHDLMILASYVRSVACVNRRLHYHDQAEVTGPMMEVMYPCGDEAMCPVELVAHGLPHRVLQAHDHAGGHDGEPQGED